MLVVIIDNLWDSHGTLANNNVISNNIIVQNDIYSYPEE